MKSNILYLMLTVVTLGLGCKKSSFDESSKGEGLGAFAVSAPVNNTMLVLNSATPNKIIKITWLAATPGINTAPTYKFVAALKTGSIDQPIVEFPSDNNGKSTQLNLTQKQLDDALKAKGIAEGVKTDFIWTIVADNGNVKVNGGILNISITRFGDGVSNFLLYGPVSDTSAVTINPILTTQTLNFKWQKSFAGKTGASVTYKVKFIKKDGDFNKPLFQFASNNNGLDSNLNVSYKDFDAALTAAGFIKPEETDSLKWSVEASSGTFTKFSDYVNDISILRDVNLYMVGDASEFAWDNANPTYMYRDQTNRSAYTYTGYFKTGEFKFISVIGSWDTQYGSNGSGGLMLKAKASDPDPITSKITTAGYYTVKVDINAMTLSITPYNATGATNYSLIALIGAFNDWNADLKMTNTTVNPHIWTVTNKFSADTELKFRANGGWDINWGAAGTNVNGKYGIGLQADASNLVVKAGTYKVMFNDLTKAYIFYSK